MEQQQWSDDVVIRNAMQLVRKIEEFIDFNDFGMPKHIEYVLYAATTALIDELALEPSDFEEDKEGQTLNCFEEAGRVIGENVLAGRGTCNIWDAFEEIDIPEGVREYIGDATAAARAATTTTDSEQGRRDGD
jgi:hypothetical protein